MTTKSFMMYFFIFYTLSKKARQFQIYPFLSQLSRFFTGLALEK